MSKLSPGVRTLYENSGLPGPRANLELLHAFARSAKPGEIEECLGFLTEDVRNSPEEYLAVCGIVASLIAKTRAGDFAGALAEAMPRASHASWRLREAVAIGIQEVSEGRMGETLDLLEPWLAGTDLEKRAVVAATCEPRLLREGAIAARVLEILERISHCLEGRPKLDEGGKVLRQALAYGWSVAIAASPEAGKKAFESLLEEPDRNLRWVCAQNLDKKRLSRMDPSWVEACKKSIADKPQ